MKFTLSMTIGTSDGVVDTTPDYLQWEAAVGGQHIPDEIRMLANYLRDERNVFRMSTADGSGPDRSRHRNSRFLIPINNGTSNLFCFYY